MPIQIQALMETIGAEKLPDGNVALLGRSPHGDEIVFIISGGTWPKFVENCQRVKGAGIATPEFLVPDTFGVKGGDNGGH